MVQDQNNEKAYGKYQFTVSPADSGVSPSSLLCQQKPLMLISCVFSLCFFMQIQTHVSIHYCCPSPLDKKEVPFIHILKLFFIEQCTLANFSYQCIFKTSSLFS